MLKFLRKYNKIILAIFGTILMVAWLAPQGIQKLGGDPRKALAFTIDGVKYTAEDEVRAAGELEGLKRFLPMILPAMGLGQEGKSDVLHWMLLKHETKQAGMLAGKGDGANFAMELGPILTQGQSVKDPQKFIDQAMAFGAAAGRITVDQFQEALGAVRGIMRYRTLYVQLPRMSDRRAVGLALDRQSSAWVDYVTIPAERAAAEIPDPTAAEVEAFFQAHRATKEGEGEMGIGYTLPARVKFEALKIDRSSIEATIPLDAIAVNQQWRQHREKYAGEFESERVNVERDMRATRVGEVMSEIHSAVQAGVMRATRVLEAQGRYKALPADWNAKRPMWEAIAQDVVKHVESRLKVTIPAPSVVRFDSQWYTDSELNDLPGVGFAVAQQGSIRTTLGVMLLSAKGSGLESAAPFPVQPMVPVVEAFVEDGSKNRYYVTVLDVRATSPPDSLEEIRERVVKDFKKTKAFEQLKGRAEEFKALVEERGVQGVADFFPASPVGNAATVAPLVVHTRAQVSRAGLMTPPQDGDRASLVDQSVREAILAAAATLDPTKPVGEQAALGVVAPIASRLEVVVARVTGYVPFTSDDFHNLGTTWFAGAAANEAAKLQSAAQQPATMASDPFSMDSLLARLHVKGPDGQVLTNQAK